MVTIDPCTRLITIFNEIVPTILITVKSDIDIRSLLETYLPKLEEKANLLSDQCNEKYTNCEKICQSCDKDKISELFRNTEEELEKIWKEKQDQENMVEAPFILI